MVFFFFIGTIIVNNICALMSIWSYGTLYRTTAPCFFKHGRQISVEVTGKRRNKGIGQEIPASDAFNCKKPSKRLSST